jgi:PKD repeat protein
VTNQDIPPVADFIYSPINFKTGELVTFNSTSYDPDGYIVNWSWNFDDGNFAYGENVTHTYWNEGTYTINLTVTDNDDLKDSMEKIVTLTNQNPIADFTYTPDYPYMDDLIYFTDESTDIDGDIVSWWWSFGDGYYSDVQNPKHIYGALGNFTVNLTITDDDGAESTVEKVIQLLESNEAPDPPVITGPDIVRADQDANFIFQSKDPNNDDVKYIVTWGDGNIDQTDYYKSDNPASVNHTWNSTLMPVMILRMTVLAEDVYGSRSLLVEKWIFVIAMKNKNYDPNEEHRPFNLILFRIFQRFSNAFPILQRILNRLS